MVGFEGATPLAVRHVGPVTPAGSGDDAVVAGVLTDLNTYWSATLPTAFGHEFAPLTGGYVSIDSSADAGRSWCITSPSQIAGNAYYCPTGDAIVYDSAGLVPVLLGHYGAAGLTASFAHEFGHAIQARIGPTAAQRTADPTKYPSLLIEAQGDCFAGAFLAEAVAGRTAHVRLPEPSMVRAVAPLLDFADPVTVRVDDPTAHGLALDRLTAVLDGYRSGAAACHALTRGALHPTLGRAGLTDTPRPHRFASTAAALAAGRPAMLALAARLPAAAGSAAAATPSAADLAAAAPYGQFAAAAALALSIGRATKGTAVGAACFAGAWTASVFGHAADGALGSWGGDADEALNMLRARPDATIGELAGFADGFARGLAACR
ncbi:Predicted metalloprotease [Nakamurella panacisegetis]|uniref:Predicted metalloprotease n=1 Tax=Nakamurella panacisegetis TaxID=1090615 RepID=A0A1H0RMM8_9ACTN|nr:neutral zinc metallopeptidase [Nakamurella panacisegetis]SDP30695.1 Predicted metalloprotease [Nakamurella panacisegetis]